LSLAFFLTLAFYRIWHLINICFRAEDPDKVKGTGVVEMVYNLFQTSLLLFNSFILKTLRWVANWSL